MVKVQIKYIRQIPLLRGLNAVQLNQIIDITEKRTIKNGEYVFKEGTVGDKVYIIIEGTIKIFTSSS